jgi:trehalose 6-phosphate synthase/phosphatase
MISGIMSVSQSHEQIIVGWPGDILTPGAAANASTTNTSADKILTTNVSSEERAELEVLLKDFQPKESDPDDEKFQKGTYVPVWLDDKIAHGHYDGYCKQSMFSISLNIVNA